MSSFQRAAAPISPSHLDCQLRAFLALGELLEASGATPEECHALYTAIAGRSAQHLGGAAAGVMEGIARSQECARERARAMAAKLGR